MSLLHCLGFSLVDSFGGYGATGNVNMKRIIILLLSFPLLTFQLPGQTLHPLTLEWEYPTNALFTLDWQGGSHTTTGLSASVSAPVGTHTFHAVATRGLFTSDPATLQVRVIGIELQTSTNLLNWTPIKTNRFALTNNLTGFYRAKLLIETE